MAKNGFHNQIQYICKHPVACSWYGSSWDVGSRHFGLSLKSPQFGLHTSSCCHQPWSRKCGKLRASIYGFAGFFPFRHVYLVCIQMHPLSFFTKSKYSLTSHIASDMNAPTSSILLHNHKLRLSSSLYFFYMNSQVSQSHCCLVPPKARTRGSCRCCESRPCWPSSPCCSCS